MGGCTRGDRAGRGSNSLSYSARVPRLPPKPPTLRAKSVSAAPARISSRNHSTRLGWIVQLSLLPRSIEFIPMRQMRYRNVSR